MQSNSPVTFVTHKHFAVLLRKLTNLILRTAVRVWKRVKTTFMGLIIGSGVQEACYTSHPNYPRDPPPPPFKFPHRTIGKIHGSKKGANNENVSLVRNQTILAVCFYNDWAISCALIGRELWSIRVQTLQNDLILAQFVFLFLTEKLQWKWMSKLSMLLQKKKNKQKNWRQFSMVYSRP